MNETREQNLAEFLDTFGVDRAAEIVMYVLREKRDTLLLARLRRHLSKANEAIFKARYNRYVQQYGEAAAKRAFKISDR